MHSGEPFEESTAATPEAQRPTALPRPWVIDIWGLAAPMFTILLVGGTGMLVPPSQAGGWSGRASMLLGGAAFHWQLLVLIWAWCSVLVVRLGARGREPATWVRAGLLAGVILGIWFSLAVALAHSRSLAALAAAVVALALLDLRPWWRGLFHAGRPESASAPARRRWITAALLCVAGLAMAAIGFETGFGILVFAMLCGPLLVSPLLFALVCGTLLRVVAQDSRSRRHRDVALPAAIAITGVSTALSIRQALADFVALPEAHNGCFIVTAAARGHRRVVRSEEVVVRGVSVRINHQLRVMKAGELALRVVTPRLHCALRRVYDRVAPRVARRVTSPWLADGVYLLLVPVACVVRLALAPVVRGRDIERLYDPG